MAKKRPDTIETYSKLNKANNRIYYLRRRSANGDKQDPNKFTSRSGRNDKVRRMKKAEPDLIVLQVKK